MYFDTHAHYDDAAFDVDRDALLASMPGQGVELILDPSQDEKSAEMVLALADRFNFLYAAVGWHPHEALSFDAESPGKLRSWAKHPKVRAIGEIGLDYHYDFAPRETQRLVFLEQLRLAAELDLPVIIHDREAHADTLDLIALVPQVRGVFHCYSGSPEMAHQLLEMGWYLSFTGAVTFKNARRALETLQITPTNRIMLETDAPYLAPVPHRGKRCDSTLLPCTAQVIADVKGLSIAELAHISLENGKHFFQIP